MAKILWNAAIEVVSGALTKINKNSQHAYDQRMILGVHRVAPSTSKSCSRLYFRTLENINFELAQTEAAIQVRNRFKDASQAIKTRRRDLTALTNDQRAFLAIRDELKTKYGINATMQSFYWRLFMHFEGQFPSGEYTFTASDYHTATLNWE